MRMSVFATTNRLVCQQMHTCKDQDQPTIFFEVALMRFVISSSTAPGLRASGSTAAAGVAGDAAAVSPFTGGCATSSSATAPTAMSAGSGAFSVSAAAVLSGSATLALAALRRFFACDLDIAGGGAPGTTRGVEGAVPGWLIVEYF